MWTSPAISYTFATQPARSRTPACAIYSRWSNGILRIAAPQSVFAQSLLFRPRPWDFRVVEIVGCGTITSRCFVQTEARSSKFVLSYKTRLDRSRGSGHSLLRQDIDWQLGVRFRRALANDQSQLFRINLLRGFILSPITFYCNH